MPPTLSLLRDPGITMRDVTSGPTTVSPRVYSICFLGSAEVYSTVLFLYFEFLVRCDHDRNALGCTVEATV